LESEAPHRLGFDLERILRTNYRIDTFQPAYFVIDSYEHLMQATACDFTPIYERLKTQSTIAAGEVLPTDTVIHRGTGVE
jgi:phenylalanine-4-hydroxylase